MNDLREGVERAWDNLDGLGPAQVEGGLRKTIDTALQLLESGQLRVAEPAGDGWKVNEWLKKAVLNLLSHHRQSRDAWNLQRVL